jgi:hypothetical protein
MAAVLGFVSLYFIVSDGSPERTKRLLGLNKLNFEYKHDLTSRLQAINVLVHAGLTFMLTNLIFWGRTGVIVWLVCSAVYFFVASICVRKFVINKKRFMI